jgi:hypothetical protein
MWGLQGFVEPKAASAGQFRGTIDASPQLSLTVLRFTLEALDGGDSGQRAADRGRCESLGQEVVHEALPGDVPPMAEKNLTSLANVVALRRMRDHVQDEGSMTGLCEACGHTDCQRVGEIQVHHGRTTTWRGKLTEDPARALKQAQRWRLEEAGAEYYIATLPGDKKVPLEDLESFLSGQAQ